MNDPTSDLAQKCKALADPARVRIVALLPRSPNCEHRNNVSQLSALLGLTQPTVSHHLKILKQAGFVQCKKMCRDVFYWVGDEAAEAFLETLAEKLKVEIAFSRELPIARD